MNTIDFENMEVLFHMTYEKKLFKNLYEHTIESYKNSGNFTTLIEGEKCKSLRRFYKEFAKKLEFPPYFNNNWDSLDECLNDLEWLNSKQYVLFFQDFHLLLSKNDKIQKRIFMGLLGSSVKEWREGRNYDSFPTFPSSFHIVIHGNDAVLNELKSNKEINEIHLF